VRATRLMKRRGFWGAALVALLGGVLLVSALPAASRPASRSATQAKPVIYFIDHACPSAGSFWDPVHNGAKEAAAALGVNLRIVSLTDAQCGSIPIEVNNLNTAIAAHPAGIATTVLNPTGFSAALKRAAAAGIPVVAVNAVPDNNDPAINPYLSYIGQSNRDAGVGIAQQAVKSFKLKAGDKVVVVDQEPFNISLTSREQGIAAGLKSVGIKPVNLNTSDTIASGIALVRAYLQQHPGVKAVMALGPPALAEIVPAVQALHLTNKIGIVSFDLDSATLHYIQQGSVAATVNQQPFLQGYQAVVQLYLSNKWGAAPQNFATGPAYLTKNNVAKLAKYVNYTGY
jgi:simple sugar transport system substrate-binding protein